MVRPMTTTELRASRSFLVRVTDAGRIVIPVDLRRELGIEAGQQVVISRDGGQIRIATLGEALRQVQEYFVGLGLPGELWSEEVIRERRRDAAKEAGD